MGLETPNKHEHATRTNAGFDKNTNISKFYSLFVNSQIVFRIM